MSADSKSTNKKPVSKISTGRMFSGWQLVPPPLFALALAGVSLPAAADDPAPRACTVEGMNWNGDPVFRAALHPSARERGVRRIACKVESARTLAAGETRLRLVAGTLFDGEADGPKLNALVINIERMEGAAGRSLARVFLGPDELDGGIGFHPQAVDVGGAILLRLSPRHPWLFRLDGEKVTAIPAFAWRTSIDDAFPEGARSGQNLSIDLERMEGRIAIRRIATGPEDKPSSAYDPARMLRARLVWRDGRLAVASSEVTTRKEGDEPFLDPFAERDETVRAHIKGLPEGIEPCSLGAWSNDTDPKGLNVRAAPDARARVLGIVPPPRRMPKEHEAFEEPAKSEFRIVGFKDGWFLVENIEAPGVAYGAPYPREAPQPFKGRGWVNGRMVGAAYANGGLPSGRLYLSPHADAGYKDALDKEGNPIGADGSPGRILACSSWWALVETREKQRGWVRTLCSNQVTNCS